MKVLYQYSHLNMSMKDAFELAKLARQLVPSDLKNLVAPGIAQTVNGSSVVVLSEEAHELFDDVRADAVAGREHDAGASRVRCRHRSRRRSRRTKPGTKPTPKPTPRPLLPLPQPPQ